MSSALHRTHAVAAVATALSLWVAAPTQTQRPTTFPAGDPAIKRI